MKDLQKNLSYVFKLSQPIYWLYTAIPFFWAYFLTSGQINLPLIIGVVYFLMPYNLLLRGLVKQSIKTDTKSGLEHKKNTWYLIAITNLPFVLYFLWTANLVTKLVIMVLVVLNFAFTYKPVKLAAIPLVDAVTYSLIAFVGPVVTALCLAQAKELYLPALIAYFAWGMASYILYKLPSIRADHLAKAHTTIATFGLRRSTNFSLGLFGVSAIIIALFYAPAGVLAGILIGLQALNVSFFKKYRSDVHTAQFKRGWNNYMWLNVLTLVGLSLILCYNLDPLGIKQSYSVIFGLSLLSLFGLQTVVTLHNVIGFRRPRAGRLNDWPKVSLLIHTYNQADNISSTLLAALGQNYPDFEIIYGDLGSKDNTVKIVKGYQDPRLRIVDISPTKAGWTVNSWAAQQLLEKANGEIVISISADTILLPSTLSTIVSLLENKSLDMVSILPADQNKTLAQQIILSQNHFLLLGAYPAYLLSQRWPKFAPAYGGLMAFKRHQIDKLNGFQTVRNSPLEDFELAASARDHGLKTGFYLGSDIATSQNHAALGLILSQNSRRFYPALHFSAPLTITTSLVGFWLFIMPTVIAAIMLVTGNYNGLAIIIVAIGLSFINRLIITISSRQSIVSTLLYPIGCIVVLVQLITSMLNYELFRPRWQDRRHAF